ncbi:MAG: LCP family protein [Candidatus Shapirobacteria bacterium]|jgi:LCP family protein required for cell wall assembly|nr:LCP family protein [Candidatus Shapirobacteria bacterium]
MKNKVSGWWIIVGLLGVVLIGLIVFYINYNKIVVKPNKVKEDTSLTLTVTPTPDPLAPYSILLLGYGGGKHEGGVLTDSIMVAKINPKNESINLISVPRDLWVSIPIDNEEVINKKINEAFLIGFDDKKYPNKKIEFTGEAGGGEMAKEVIGKVVGFKIDYFTSIDFDGFVKIIDILGGIDVTVPYSWEDTKYPLETNINDSCGKTDEEITALTATMSGEKLEDQFMCRYETLKFEKGKNHLDGITALKYTRSRHSKTNGGDFNRAERQKQIITATRDKVVNIGFVTKIIPTINTLTRHIKTDINISKMGEFVSKFAEISKYKINSIALTDQNVLMNSKSNLGQFILIPKAGENNWEEIHLFIENEGTTTPPTIDNQN